MDYIILLNLALCAIFLALGINHYECQVSCPKGIKVAFIANLNREFIKARMP